MSLVDELADKLAKDALEAAAAAGDDSIVDQVSMTIGATSTTLQESYLTSIRMRRAEMRGRDLLETFKKGGSVDDLLPPPDLGDGH